MPAGIPPAQGIEGRYIVLRNQLSVQAIRERPAEKAGARLLFPCAFQVPGSKCKVATHAIDGDDERTRLNTTTVKRGRLQQLRVLSECRLFGERSEECPKGGAA